MSAVAKGLVTIANLFPIFLIVALMCFRDRAPFAGGIFLVAAAAGALATIYVFYAVTSRDGGAYVDVKNAKPSEEDVIVYVTSFMPPFVAEDISNVYVALSLTIFYGFLLMFLVTTRRMFANPVLLAFGVRFYTGTIELHGRESEVLILSVKKDMASKPRLRLSSLGFPRCYVAT
jgi:hypothetical protein